MGLMSSITGRSSEQCACHAIMQTVRTRWTIRRLCSSSKYDRSRAPREPAVPGENLSAGTLVPQRPEFTPGPRCNNLTTLATSLCQGGFMNCVQLIAVFATLLPLAGGLGARDGQAAPQNPARQHDYPTATRPDRALVCMAANGTQSGT